MLSMMEGAWDMQFEKQAASDLPNTPRSPQIQPIYNPWAKQCLQSPVSSDLSFQNNDNSHLQLITPSGFRYAPSEVNYLTNSGVYTFWNIFWRGS